MVTIVQPLYDLSQTCRILATDLFICRAPRAAAAPRASSTPRALPTGVGAANPRCSCAARRTREKVRSVGVRAVRLPPMWYSVSGCCARAPRARARKPAAFAALALSARALQSRARPAALAFAPQIPQPWLAACAWAGRGCRLLRLPRAPRCSGQRARVGGASTVGRVTRARAEAGNIGPEGTRGSMRGWVLLVADLTRAAPRRSAGVAAMLRTASFLVLAAATAPAHAARCVACLLCRPRRVMLRRADSPRLVTSSSRSLLQTTTNGCAPPLPLVAPMAQC